MDMMDLIEKTMASPQSNSRGMGGIQLSELAPIFQMMKEGKKDKKNEEKEEAEKTPIISSELHDKVCELCDIMGSHFALQAAKTQLEIALIKNKLKNS